MTLYVGNHKEKDLPFCKCGCGKRVAKKGNRYLFNHHVKHLKIYEQMVKKAKCLKGKTWEEMHGVKKAERMKKRHIEFLKKRRFSDETKALWSSRRKGSGNSFYGKHHSEETKEKIRKHFSGKHLSEEHKRNVSVGLSKAVKEGRMNRKSKKYDEGEFYSSKNGKFIKYRSSYELFAYEMFENMKKVKSYEAEPFHIEYVNEKMEIRRYIPDILVTYVDGSEELIEVKPRNFISLTSNKCKFLAAEKFSMINGMDFSILTSNKGNTDVNKVGMCKIPVFKKDEREVIV